MSKRIKHARAKYRARCERACLDAVAKHNGRRLTLKIMAAEMGVSPRTAERTVNRLFERKLVKKAETSP